MAFRSARLRWAPPYFPGNTETGVGSANPVSRRTSEVKTQISNTCIYDNFINVNWRASRQQLAVATTFGDGLRDAGTPRLGVLP